MSDDMAWMDAPAAPSTTGTDNHNTTITSASIDDDIEPQVSTPIPHHARPSADEVWPNLYVGPERAVDDTHLSVHVCVNVAREVHYGPRRLADLTQRQIIHYRFPMADDSEYNLDQTEEIIELIHLHISHQRRVLLHCFMGISRSIAVAVRYVMRYHGLSFDAAFDHIRSRRSMADPNPGFKAQLRIYKPPGNETTTASIPASSRIESSSVTCDSASAAESATSATTAQAALSKSPSS